MTNILTTSSETSEGGYDLPYYTAISISFVTNTQTAVIEYAGYGRVSTAFGAGGSLAIGTFDLFNAAQNGTANDVILLSF